MPGGPRTAASARRAILSRRLERQEIAPRWRANGGRPWPQLQQAGVGEHITGTLVGAANLTSGRFAMIETFSGEGGLGFSLVPWQSVLDQRIGQHIAGIMRDGGGIDWTFSRQRGIGL